MLLQQKSMGSARVLFRQRLEVGTIADEYSTRSSWMSISAHSLALIAMKLFVNVAVWTGINQRVV